VRATAAEALLLVSKHVDHLLPADAYLALAYSVQDPATDVRTTCLQSQHDPTHACYMRVAAHCSSSQHKQGNKLIMIVEGIAPSICCCKDQVSRALETRASSALLCSPNPCRSTQTLQEFVLIILLHAQSVNERCSCDRHATHVRAVFRAMNALRAFIVEKSPLRSSGDVTHLCKYLPLLCFSVPDPSEARQLYKSQFCCFSQSQHTNGQTCTAGPSVVWGITPGICHREVTTPVL
jgi:hypothetical protein